MKAILIALAVVLLTVTGCAKAGDLVDRAREKTKAAADVGADSVIDLPCGMTVGARLRLDDPDRQNVLQLCEGRNPVK